MVKKYVPDRMDIVWIDLNPTRGHEQANIRPALVLSPLKYNQFTGMMIACPITSQSKGFSYEVLLNEKKVTGVILSDQIRNLDWRTRKVRFIQKAPVSTFNEVREKISTLFE